MKEHTPAPLRPRRTVSGCFFSILTWFFGLLIILSAALSTIEWAFYMSSTDWKPTSATLVEVNAVPYEGETLKEPWNGEGQLEVVYEYTAKGNAFRGTDLGIMSYRNRLKARRYEELKELHEAGAEITVWVDPQSPDSAMLFREIHLEMFVGYALLLLFFGGLAGWKWGMRKKPGEVIPPEGSLKGREVVASYPRGRWTVILLMGGALEPWVARRSSPLLWRRVLSPLVMLSYLGVFFSTVGMTLLPYALVTGGLETGKAARTISEVSPAGWITLALEAVIVAVIALKGRPFFSGGTFFADFGFLVGGLVTGVLGTLVLAGEDVGRILVWPMAALFLSALLAAVYVGYVFAGRGGPSEVKTPEESGH